MFIYFISIFISLYNIQLFYIGNFNKAWHERIEIESTDNESILINHHSIISNKKSKFMNVSDSSDIEGKYYYL